MTRKRFEQVQKAVTPIPYSPDDVDFKGEATIPPKLSETVVFATQDDRAQSLAFNHVGGAKNYSFKVGSKVIKVKVWESA